LNNLNIPILYEDADVLVINKPAEIDMAELAEDPKYQFAVHRLDKDTSGVLLCAKSEEIKEKLQEQFKNRTVKKTYLALVYGQVKMFTQQSGGGPLGRTELVIDYPIGRSRNDPRKRVARVKTSGKERDALTKISVKEILGDYTLIEARPETGRTHQIRVHLKAIHHPVVCDKLYAAGKTCPAGLSRQALHAAKLEFALPSGEALTVEAPIPSDLEQAIAFFSKV